MPILLKTLTQSKWTVTFAKSAMSPVLGRYMTTPVINIVQLNVARIHEYKFGSTNNLTKIFISGLKKKIDVNRKILVSI